MIYKRLLSFLLVLILIITMIVPTPVSVYADSNSIRRNSVESRLRVIQEKLTNPKINQCGLLQQINYLIEYQLYLKFLQDVDIGFTTQEKSLYIGYCRDAIVEFNNSFSNNDNNSLTDNDTSAENTSEKANETNNENITNLNNLMYEPLELTTSKDVNKLIQKNVLNKIPDYLNTVLANIKDKIDATSDDKEKVQIKNENLSILKCVNYVIETYLDTQLALTNITPNKEQFKIDGTSDNSKIKEKLLKIKNTYTDLFNYVEEEIKNENQNNIDNMTIDTSKNAVEIFSNAVYNNGTLQIPEQAELTKNYLALLSASSVYTPFKSYAGSEEFIAAATSIANTDDIAAVYNDTKNLRKPLYKRELDQNGNPTGTAKLVTLQEFIDSVLKGDSCAFVTVKGIFKLDEKTNTWVYSQDDVANGTVKEDDDKDYTEPNEDGSTVESEQSEDEVQSNENSTENNTESTTEQVLSISKYNAPKVFAKTTETTEKDNSSKTDEITSDQITPDQGDTIALDTNNTPWTKLVAYAKKSHFKYKVKDLVGDSKCIAKIREVLVDMKSNNNKFSENLTTDSFDSFFSTLKKFDKVSIREAFNKYYEQCNSDKGESNQNDTTDNTDNTDNTTNSNNNDNLKDDIDGDVEDNEISNIVRSAIFAYDELTETTRMSEPVLLIGTQFQRATDNMTTVILNNIIRSVTDLESIKDRETRFVYINSFGDIVLDDNLVILPGIANPLLYSKESQYNPYTVAFMNSYPTFLNGTGTKFELLSVQDVGKYVLLADCAGSDKKYFYPENVINGVYAYKTTSVHNLSQARYLCRNLSLDFQYGSSESDIVYPFIYKNYLYTFDNDLTKEGVMPFSLLNRVIINEKSTFPYNLQDDVNFALAKVIALVSYNKLTQNDDNSYKILNDNYILHNILITGVEGTNSPVAYQKNAVLQYDSFVKNSDNRFKTLLHSTSKNLVDSLSKIDGVIGLKNPLNINFIGDGIRFLQDNILFVFVLIVIMITFSFVRNTRDLFKSVIAGGFSIFVTYLFVCVVPTFSTYIFNSVSNNITSNLSYRILISKAELFDEDNFSLREDGSFDMKTESITLYRYTLKNINNVCDSLNIDRKDITGGNKYVINENAGMFIENDSLKMNTDVLLNTLKIKGEYSLKDNSFDYTLKSYKTSSNNLDYYTPYYQIVDNFIDKLNTLSSVYNLPKRTTTYKNGKQKESFLVYSYLNSPVFLTPGDYKPKLNVEFENSNGVPQSELNQFYAQEKSYQSILDEAFGKNDDWLGVSNFLWDINDKYKNTVWANTLRINNYYNEDWTPNKEKMPELIHYINYQTRKFVVDMDDLINQMPDDNLIKIICMRALIALNQKASEYSNMLYPLFLNYEEVTLRDLLLSVYTDNYSKFVSMDSDVCRYIMQEYGWLALVLFDTTIILIYLLVTVLNILFPLLYISLGFLLLFKFFSYKNTHPLIKGYFKSTIILFILFSSFCCSFTLISILKKSFISILISFAFASLFLWVLFNVLTSIIFNITELGNTAISVKMNNLFNSPIRMKRTNVNQMYVDNSNFNMNDEEDYDIEYYRGLSKYNNDNDINKIYDNDNIGR